MTTKLEVDDIADFDVDDAEETLIALLELALVEDLDSDDRVLLDGTGGGECEMDGTGGRKTRHTCRRTRSSRD